MTLNVALTLELAGLKETKNTVRIKYLFEHSSRISRNDPLLMPLFFWEFTTIDRVSKCLCLISCICEFKTVVSFFAMYFCIF
jgi:hypothetical protein